ncbi:cyp8 [Malassezia furfur]|nr:cyp8 [Malassezia furfur]
MGHGTNDKLFVTPSEHSGVYGRHGASTGARKAEAAVVVPFDMCALTHEAWRTPACLPDEGLVYERANLERFLDKYHVSPASGRPASRDEILALHMARNERGQLYDPVSCKELTDHSHLVAVKPTGNVFLYDTVQQLNLKPKMLRDLVDDTPFTKADLLTLQDPHDPERRTMQKLYHVQNKLTLATTEQADEVHMSTGSTRALLSQVRQHSAADDAPKEVPKEAASGAGAARAPRLSNLSTGRTAASFTSSSLTPRTKTERIEVDEEAEMFDHVASASKHPKALVRLMTNFGALDLELHVDKAPRTCYNFLELCRRGTYKDTLFHRNIPGFMLQGGDPTGTGRGGQSIWGKPFEDELVRPGAFRHTARGVLSMANRGPNTNGSQFFVTYRATPHLDTKHTVFGRLVGEPGKSASFRTLDALENVPSDDTDRPLREIRVFETNVVEDPFEAYKQQRDAKYRREHMDDAARAERDAKRRKRDEDRTTWLGTRLADGAAAEPRQSKLPRRATHTASRASARRARRRRRAPRRAGSATSRSGNSTW